MANDQNRQLPSRLRGAGARRHHRCHLSARDELALVLLPGVQYYTVQVLPMADITKAGHAVGARVGFDLVHAAGNVVLDLHDWGVDFAAWCSYRYLNGGPGCVGGAFVHNRHVADPLLAKFLGERPDGPKS